MGKKKKEYSKKEDIGICRDCGKHFNDYQQKHRKYICKECWNAHSKKASRKIASNIEGYFKITLRDIKNNPNRNKHPNDDIDVDYLMKLYELQDGRCAISGIKMTWGYGDTADGKRRRKPFNVSVERLDNEKGYTKDNIILVCNAINLFKSTNDVSVVYEIAQEIVKNEDRLGGVMENIMNNLAS